MTGTANSHSAHLRGPGAGVAFFLGAQMAPQAGAGAEVIVRGYAQEDTVRWFLRSEAMQRAIAGGIKMPPADIFAIVDDVLDGAVLGLTAELEHVLETMVDAAVGQISRGRHRAALAAANVARNADFPPPPEFVTKAVDMAVSRWPSPYVQSAAPSANRRKAMRWMRA